MTRTRLYGFCTACNKFITHSTIPIKFWSSPKSTTCIGLLIFTKWDECRFKGAILCVTTKSVIFNYLILFFSNSESSNCPRLFVWRRTCENLSGRVSWTASTDVLLCCGCLVLTGTADLCRCPLSLWVFYMSLLDLMYKTRLCHVCLSVFPVDLSYYVPRCLN